MTHKWEALYFPPSPPSPLGYDKFFSRKLCGEPEVDVILEKMRNLLHLVKKGLVRKHLKYLVSSQPP